MGNLCVKQIISTLWSDAANVSSQYLTEFSELLASHIIPTVSPAWSAPRVWMEFPSLWTLQTRSTALMTSTGGLHLAALCVVIQSCQLQLRSNLWESWLWTGAFMWNVTGILISNLTTDILHHYFVWRCVDCNVLLSSEEEGRGCYPLDNDVLCKGCNTRRIQALTSALKLSWIWFYA